jgi:hypothetical protein
MAYTNNIEELKRFLIYATRKPGKNYDREDTHPREIISSCSARKMPWKEKTIITIKKKRNLTGEILRTGIASS